MNFTSIQFDIGEEESCDQPSHRHLPTATNAVHTFQTHSVHIAVTQWLKRMFVKLSRPTKLYDRGGNKTADNAQIKISKKSRFIV